MTRTRDPFPVQGRLRHRYQPAEIDPLEIELAKAEAREQRLRDQVAHGHTPLADPIELRGIPVIARGVGGTSPGTNPHRAVR